MSNYVKSSEFEMFAIATLGLKYGSAKANGLKGLFEAVALSERGISVGKSHDRENREKLVNFTVKLLEKGASFKHVRENRARLMHLQHLRESISQDASSENIYQIMCALKSYNE